MANLSLKKLVKKSAFLGGLNFCWSNILASTTSDLPFVSTTQKLEKAISGPFLLSISIIMVVVTCVMLSFGEWGDGFKRIINIVLWLSVAFAATSFITSMFSTGAII